MHPNALDLTGQRYGLLVVVGPTGQSNKNQSVLWKCKCDCGGKHTASSQLLRRGLTRSCGCLKNKGPLRHGHSRKGHWTPTYRSWAAMMQRCRDPKTNRFAYYGGRGITVCRRWCVFDNFLADMGERPAGRSLERQDNNKGYSPTNCRWATAKEQAQNTSRNRRIVAWGETLTMAAWAERLGVHRARIERWLRKGETLETFRV